MCNIGDVLSIGHGLYRHYMIVVGNDRVVHASKEKKIVVDECLSNVCQDKAISNHGRWSQLSDAEIIWRAKNELGKPYRIIDWNCEHVVRRISGLEETSPQIKWGVGACVVGLGLFLVMRKQAA